MEVRRLLSTVIVDTLADESIANSTTSLREAIVVARANDTIQFKAGLAGAITLGGAELLLARNLTIAGPGLTKLTVSGNDASRVFRVATGVNATISGITIQSGRAEDGAGLYNAGTLQLSNVKFVSNNARGLNGSATDGGDGRGGAIYNTGTLGLTGCEFLSNGALGGNGQMGSSPQGNTLGNGGAGYGGAIYNTHNVVIHSTKFITNGVLGGTPDGGSFGNVGGGDGGFAYGGAVYNLGAVELSGCEFLANLAVGSSGGDGDLIGGAGGDAAGGAVYNAGHLGVEACVFPKNGATGGAGGQLRSMGLYNDGGAASGGAIFGAGGLDVSMSNFNANYAVAGNGRDAAGGAITSLFAMAIVNSTVAGNTAKADQNGEDNFANAGATARGGGLYIGGDGGAVLGSTLVDNHAVGGAGGRGYHLHGNDHASAAGGDALGGGLFAAGPVLIGRSTVTNNRTTGGVGGEAHLTTQSPGAKGGNAGGAGIYAAGVDFTVSSSTLVGNVATGGKGGFGISDNPGGQPLPAGANGAATGGGFLAGGPATFSNSIVAMNAATQGGADVLGAVDSLGFNLIGSATDSSGWIASDLTGTKASRLDPRLGPIANNGGGTRTMAPLAGSPVIDAGKSFGHTADQRGTTRPRDLAGIPNALGGDGADIGAVELQTAPSNPQTPFTNSTIGQAPLTIQNEDFDNGGEGIAYHDADAANQGDNGYRRGTGVDLKTVQNDSGVVYVGFTKAGEWLEYTVNVAAAGTYAIDFRVASGGAGGTFHLEVDGVNKTGAMTVPNTGGWQTWKTLTKTGVQLPAGTHVLRLALDSVGPTGSVGNFNYLKFTRTTFTVGTSTAAHVRDGTFATQNFGTSGVLEVKKSTPSWTREAFVKFDLSSVASIDSAKLRVFGKLGDAGSLPIGVYAANSGWTEGGVTWNNRPTAGSLVGSLTVSGTTAKWYEVDLTAFLKAEKAAGRNVVTLALKAQVSSTTVCSFASDEVANGPQLVIQQ